jgi:deoxycytidylate deaminase
MIRETLLQEANKSYMNIKVAAVLLHRDRIIAKGHNGMKHKYIKNNCEHEFTPNKYVVHAEFNCIFNCKNIKKYNLRDCKIVLVKIKNGKIRKCEPCEICQKLLFKFKIEKYSYIK